MLNIIDDSIKSSEVCKEQRAELRTGFKKAQGNETLAAIQVILHCQKFGSADVVNALKETLLDWCGILRGHRKSTPFDDAPSAVQPARGLICSPYIIRG